MDVTVALRLLSVRHRKHIDCKTASSPVVLSVRNCSTKALAGLDGLDMKSGGGGTTGTGAADGRPHERPHRLFRGLRRTKL